MFSLSDRYQLGSCTAMGASYVTGEPDISTAGAEAWRTWWGSLTYDQRATWASAKTGRTLIWPNDSTTIMNEGKAYYEGGGGAYAPTATTQYAITSTAAQSLGEQMAREAERNKKLILGVAVVAVVGLVLYNRRKR
jgi:hypothetical protein